jgi:hypothetical protein
LRSPKNAERLLASLAESKANDKKPAPAMKAVDSIEKLRRELGL